MANERCEACEALWADVMPTSDHTCDHQCESILSSVDLLSLGLYVIEEKRRNRDKNLGPWKVVAAFVKREDVYSFYGKYHQGRVARVLSPNQESATTKLPVVVEYRLEQLCACLANQDRLREMTNAELVRECLKSNASDYDVVNEMMTRLHPGWENDPD